MSEREKVRDLTVRQIAERNPRVDVQVVAQAQQMIRELRSAGVQPQTYQITSSYESGSRGQAQVARTARQRDLHRRSSEGPA
jgi:hypothetical protein